MSGPQRLRRGPAEDRLTLALLDLAASGRRPPCGEPGAADLFLAEDYLAGNGGEAPAKDVLRAGRADGIAERTLQRARARAGVTSRRRGFGQGSVWVLDPSFPPQSRHSRQGSEAGMNGANVAGMDGRYLADDPRPQAQEPVTSVTELQPDPDRNRVTDVTEGSLNGRAQPTACSVCELPLDPAVAADGFTTHPTCGAAS